MNSSQAYRILGLTSGASKAEIKSAYRHLSLKYHPDKTDEPNAEETFKKINAAYQLLSSATSDDHFRDVGEVRARRAAQAARNNQEATEQAQREEHASGKPISEIFGVFNFGEDLFGQIVDAAKNKSKNQK